MLIQVFFNHPKPCQVYKDQIHFFRGLGIVVNSKTGNGPYLSQFEWRHYFLSFRLFYWSEKVAS